MFKCSLANCILRLTTAYLKFGVHLKKKKTNNIVYHGMKIPLSLIHDSSKRLSFPIQLSKKWNLPGMAQTRMMEHIMQQLRKQVPLEVGSSKRTVTWRPEQPAVTVEKHADRRKLWRRARYHKVWLLEKSMFNNRNCAIVSCFNLI